MRSQDLERKKHGCMRWKRNEKTDGISEVSTHSDPTQTNPTFSREDLGAVISDAKVQKLFETTKFVGEKVKKYGGY